MKAQNNTPEDNEHRGKYWPVCKRVHRVYTALLNAMSGDHNRHGLDDSASCKLCHHLISQSISLEDERYVRFFTTSGKRKCATWYMFYSVSATALRLDDDAGT